MIHQFEGFYKPPGYAISEGNSQLISLNGASQSFAFAEGHLSVMVSSNVKSASIQLGELPKTTKFSVGAKLKTPSTHVQYTRVELAAARTDVMSRGTTNAQPTAPDLPTVVTYSTASALIFKVLKPSTNVNAPPETAELEVWTEPAVNLVTGATLEIEYDFAQNKIRVFVDGVQRTDLDYAFSEEQKNYAYRPTLVLHSNYHTGTLYYAYVHCLFASDAHVGAVDTLRLNPNVDGTSAGFPAGDKFDKVVNKANGLKATESARAEFGLQDLPASTRPLAVMINASVSAVHLSAAVTNADVNLTINDNTVPTDTIPLPRMVSGHTHMVKELPEQPGGQPWTEATVNSLTAGVSLKITEPFPK